MLKTEAKEIDGHQVSASAWPFLKMMKRKRRIIQGLTGSGGALLKYFTTEEEVDISTNEAEAESFGGLMEGFQELIGSMSEKDMEEFIGWVFETVHIDGIDMSNPDDRDITLAGESALFYKVALFVLEVTYGDFLEMGRTLFGKFAEGKLSLPKMTPKK